MTFDGKDQATQWFSSVYTVDRFDCALGLPGLEYREKTTAADYASRAWGSAGDGADLPW